MSKKFLSNQNKNLKKIIDLVLRKEHHFYQKRFACNNSMILEELFSQCYLNINLSKDKSSPYLKSIIINSEHYFFLDIYGFGFKTNKIYN